MAARAQRELAVTRALQRLEDDGLVWRSHAVPSAPPRTTRRLQAALARAAFQLYGRGEEDASFDLRVPIATALLELYGDAVSDEELVGLVDALVPIEAAELDPRAHLERAGRARDP